MAVEYKFMKSEHGDEYGCESCGYEAPLHSFRQSRHLPKKTVYRRLCELCAGSFTANATEYSEQYHDKNAMMTICYVGNAILDQLGKFVGVETEIATDEEEEERD